MAWQELVEHVCLHPGSISQNRGGHLNVCVENMLNLRSCRVIAYLHHGISFGR